MYKRSILTYLCVFVILGLIILSGCKKKYTPKPRGYFRIDLPEKKYQKLIGDFPFVFDYSQFALIKNDSSTSSGKYWINIEYPEINGKIHISYLEIKNNLNQILEDTRKLAYKHSIKADAINERMFIKPEKKVYGILYEIQGNAASSMQFFLTDSINHYLRGALYFNVEPNKDSLAPILNFVKADITFLIESFEWKEFN
ncbi:MAG: gliding motility lipoprotein GldD [Bacteroidales bacterium]|jgi:gliding motility-associated lipoprotein GldD|nr:gliding motility lipoprotein GldD [Bacteroidales bacterium]